jgi:DUF971 family protein
VTVQKVRSPAIPSESSAPAQSVESNAKAAKISETKDPQPKVKKSLKIISATERESTKIKQILPIGKYAIKPIWADDHDTGIFTFDYLSEISTREER